jgi:glycosyltransferase involved in cell wall biosynthesis
MDRVTRPPALVLTPRLPWPLDDGGRIGLWQTVWSVSRRFDTTLVSMVPSGEADQPVPTPIEELGIRLVRVPHRAPWMPLALLRGALGRWPYMLARYRDAGFDATLRRLVAERRPDLVFINALHLTTYLDALDGVPAVLRAHNLEHRWLARYADRLRNPLARLYARHQVMRMRRAEAELCSRCALVLAISEEEAQALRALAPGARVETVPLGIDLDRYRPRAPEDPPIVALIGSWEWPPNVDGAREFIDRGWPRVRDREPGARLRVVGKGLTSEFAEVARRAGADVIGYVDDMAAEFARASVLVVPTPIGAEGLGLESGVHASLAESPELLGEAVVELLRHPDRARAMAEAGCRLMRERYSLAAVGGWTAELCALAAAPVAGSR